MAPKGLDIVGHTSGMWWVGEKKLPVGNGFAIAWPVLLQNMSNSKTMAVCSSSRLHFLKFKLLF